MYPGLTNTCVELPKIVWSWEFTWEYYSENPGNCISGIPDFKIFFWGSMPPEPSRWLTPLTSQLQCPCATTVQKPQVSTGSDKNMPGNPGEGWLELLVLKRGCTDKNAICQLGSWLD